MLGEHLADDPDGDGERQDGPRVRLDQYGVAGGEVGEEAGIRVPRRERVAPDDEPDAPRDDGELLRIDGWPLALRLLPLGGGRVARLLLVGVRDGLERSVLGVRAARLEGHHEGLPRGVHDGVRDSKLAALMRVCTHRHGITGLNSG